MCFKWCFKFTGLLLFIACEEADIPNKAALDKPAYKNKDTLFTVRYARHFGFLKKQNAPILFITENDKDTLFFESKKTYHRLAVLGTIPVFQLYLLNALHTLVAIDDRKYYHLPLVQTMYSQKKISEVLPNLQWNYEQLLSSKPDLLITYSSLNHHPKVLNILKNEGITAIPYLDYLEQHPLARAEWIKVIGYLIAAYPKAEMVFSKIEKRYQSLQTITDTIQKRPKVFTEVLYGDIWYIAGNKSYIAQLIKDAGGKYVFDFHNYENAQPFSLEYVLQYAQDADFWIHLQHFQSLKELQTANSKYTLFKAFQKKHCYNNNKRRNTYGYNDFYESGICQPHLILEDLIYILHPEKMPEKHQLHYYRLLP